jgi:hypothetical protein
LHEASSVLFKRIPFATRGGAAEDFPARWRAAAAGASEAPRGACPHRVVICTVLADMTPDAVHDGIGIEWFADTAHLARFEAWLASPAGAAVDKRLAEALDVARSPVVVAEEHVLRGREWLERRWQEGGEKLKHMAIARRAPGLSPAQFSELWKSRAGKVGRTAIPERARGLAYVQNHPVPASEGSWEYDAVNEVYFDDMDGVRARMAFFAGAPTEDDLVGENWFVVAREETVAGGREAPDVK